MSKRLILHLGTQKTGSKAVQHFLGKHERLLRENDMEVFRGGYNGIWHQEFFLDFKHEYLTQLHEALKSHQQIISWENAFSFPDLVYDYLATENALFILFLREPSDWMNSFLNQMVKAHRISAAEIDSFSSINAFYPLRNLIEFGERLERQRKVPMHIVKYDKGQNSIAKFLELIGIAHEDAIDRTIGESRNLALNSFGLRIFYSAKKRLGDSSKDSIAEMVSRLIAFCKQQSLEIYSMPLQEPLLMRPATLACIEDYYRPKIEELFKLSFSDPALPSSNVVDFSDPDPVSEEVLREFFKWYANT